MAGIETTVEAGDVGLDESRLERITSHFDRYVADGRLAGYLATVARGGEVAYVGMGGYRDREADKPMTADTIFRIYSMTKPITTVAAMRLWEEGRFELTDEIAPIIGAFKDPRVFVGGSLNDPITAPSQEPIRIWHLMTHTAGMTYGFQYTHTVDGLYRKAGYEWGSPAGVDLAGACETWASLPLLFEPGTSWNYSIATDVLGRVIECVTGERLDVALRRLVLDPLGMDETSFFAPEDVHDRVAQLYIPDGSNGMRAFPVPDMGKAALRDPFAHSGGGGLVSTAHDYKRFTGMLLAGGELDGVRILSPRTLDYMTRNHLPGDVDLEVLAEDTFSETAYAGVGFGLGFAVVLDSRPSRVPTTEGSYSWGGAASTAFWVDPAEGLEVAFYTQLLPSGTHPIRSQLSQLVYSSIID
ncbi:MAG: serine hydrolase domain-containing protein [Actinomycetes bacterium]